MKIGLVCPYSMARGGAVQEIVIAMRQELMKRGHEVFIITPRPKEAVTVDTEGMIFVGASTNFRSPMGTTTDLSSSTDNEEIKEVLEREQFDILHFHEPYQPFLSRQLLTYSKSVNIATFHAKLPDSTVSRTFIKAVTPYTKPLLKYLHELVAVSDAASEYVGGMTSRHITIIPNAIHVADFPPAPARYELDGKKKKILFIGRLERRKGVKYLIEAFGLLAQQREDVELIIAGKGPYREKLEQVVFEEGIPNVQFLGYVDDATKKQLFAEADLFCAPAVFGESFGIVLLEAMSTGLITIAGNNPGYAGVMQGVGSMSLVNPKDAVEFARRMEMFLDEPDLRKLWREWALEYVKQFDYPIIADQYEKLYQEALVEHEGDFRNILKKAKKPKKEKKPKTKRTRVA